MYTNLANETAGCIKLTIGEPDLDTPDAIKQTACQALLDGQTHYAPNQGSCALRKAIAAHEAARCGFSFDEENILITAGATGALYTALLGVLRAGDEVIIPTPAFPLYETITNIAGAKPVFLDLTKTGFQITQAALASAITPKTKAIILNSPNNPTGVVLNDSSMRAVKNAVLGKDIYLICDNVYAPLCMQPCPDLSEDVQLKSQVLLCQSFSKPYAMTGWRVGYLAAQKDVIAGLLLLHAAQVAAIPTFLQTACITALRTDISEMREIYRRRCGYVCSRLAKMGLSFPQPDGAFYVFADISRFGLTSDEFCTRLIRQAKVAAVPGSCFGADGYIRISYACSEQDLQEGLDRLENFLATL